MRLEHAIELAWALLDQYGLGDDFTVVIDRKKKTLGHCSNGHKAIALSLFHIEADDVAEVRDTILHEIAHALTPGHGHDEVWQAKAMQVGARPFSGNPYTRINCGNVIRL